MKILQKVQVTAPSRKQLLGYAGAVMGIFAFVAQTYPAVAATIPAGAPKWAKALLGLAGLIMAYYGAPHSDKPTETMVTNVPDSAGK